MALVLPRHHAGSQRFARMTQRQRKPAGEVSNKVPIYVSLDKDRRFLDHFRAFRAISASVNAKKRPCENWIRELRILPFQAPE